MMGGAGGLEGVNMAKVKRVVNNTYVSTYLENIHFQLFFFFFYMSGWIYIIMSSSNELHEDVI